MSLKSIVKVALNANWLPPEVCSAHERESLAAELLLGSYKQPLPNAEPSLTRTYLQGKAAQIAGQPALLLELLGDVEPSSITTSPDESEKRIREECAFLRGYALSRLGQERKATQTFSSLPLRFRPQIQIERALLALNRGDFPKAETLFREALNLAANSAAMKLEPFSICTLLGGLSLTLIYQGEFRGAESCLRERKRVLDQHPSPVLEFGTRLYEILLLLERNAFDRAAALIQHSLTETTLSSVNGFFITYLNLRLHLARNQLSESARILSDLRSLQSELQLGESVLDYRLEEIDLQIRSQSFSIAQSMISSVETTASGGRDDYLLFRTLLLKAQLALHCGSPDSALKEVERALELGETRHYRPGLSWALFHAAGIALANDSLVKARLFLNRGRRLAGELHLEVRAAALSYMADVLDNRHAQASALVSLIKNREIGPELEYFLEAYRLLESIAMTVNDGRQTTTINEANLRRRLLREPGLFWFPREGILLSSHAPGQVASIEFETQSPLNAAFRLFWNDFHASGQRGSRGLSLREIHKTRLGCTYREDLHSAAAKMTISRLRELLKPTGLSLRYQRQAARYFLIKPNAVPALIVQSSTAEKSFSPAGTDRESELYARISMESFVTTRVLCQEFGISRQALNPYLRSLVSQRKVKLVRRGPVSGYMAL